MAPLPVPFTPPLLGHSLKQGHCHLFLLQLHFNCYERLLGKQELCQMTLSCPSVTKAFVLRGSVHWKRIGLISKTTISSTFFLYVIYITIL